MLKIDAYKNEPNNEEWLRFSLSTTPEILNYHFKNGSTLNIPNHLLN